jgi:hypothetical protein
MVWLPESENFNRDKLNHKNDHRKSWYEDICKFEVVRRYSKTNFLIVHKRVLFSHNGIMFM